MSEGNHNLKKGWSVRKVKEISIYWKRIYDSRYFWLHLALMDLRNKFRRSKLGILWVCVSPLGLMGIMTVVFGTVFHEEISSYAPYVLSGLLFWTIVTDSLIAGWSSISGNEPYIRQFNHPVIIYPLEKAIASIISFAISMLSLVAIVLFTNPYNVVIGILTMPITIIIYFTLGWCGTIISAFIGTKYRDYPQLITLLLQAVWYISPVFLQESVFQSNPVLYRVYIYNPITHLLKLIRTPFLDGKVPSVENYAVSLGLMVIFAAIAILSDKKNEKNIIFYV